MKSRKKTMSLFLMLALLSCNAVHCKYYDEYKIRHVWDDFLDALAASDIQKARTYIHPLSQQWFDNYASRLGDKITKLPELLCHGDEIKLETLEERAAEYALCSKLENSLPETKGKTSFGSLRFAKDADNNWKIEMF